MRRLHRHLAVFAVLVGLFIAATGTIVQVMDLSALLRHAPATDPAMQSIRAGIFGPPNFRVIRDGDYAARPLAPGFDFGAALATVLTATRSTLGDAPLSFVELRAAAGGAEGRVASGGIVHRFDPATGAGIGAAEKVVFLPNNVRSTRNTIKDIHRMRWFGAWGVAVDMVAGLLMAVAIVTGLAVYVQLWRARARARRTAVFWYAGGWWRTLHRGIAVASGLVLLFIAATGTVLATSSLGVSVYTKLYGPKRPGMSNDLSSPIPYAELPAMLRTTLAAQREADADAPIKVVRLRYYAGMPQGVVIAGGDDPEQRTFNAATGAPVSFTEPGYPATGQTFGWQVDETFKQLHRGDAFGLLGRWISLLAGFALLYLSLSGGWMYYELWSRRRRAGRGGLFWS